MKKFALFVSLAAVLTVMVGCSALNKLKNQNGSTPPAFDLAGSWEVVASSTSNPGVISIVEFNVPQGTNGNISVPAQEFIFGTPATVLGNCLGVIPGNPQGSVVATVGSDNIQGSFTETDPAGDTATFVINAPLTSATTFLWHVRFATQVFADVFSGVRSSELAGLKWKCIHPDSISINERFSRGDWSKTKTKGSAATVAVDPMVIRRIEALKSLTVTVRAGRAIREHKVVKGTEPDDLVFCGVWKGRPMNASNILKRFIKPAAEKLGLKGVDWRCLRCSYGTWSVDAGIDPKSVCAQMRHSRISTTMDIYCQVLPESQKRAARKLTEYVAVEVEKSGPKSGPLLVQ